jgi:hypothetical protein
MPDFSFNFKGPKVRLRGRNVALPASEANVNEFNTNVLRWDTIFNAAYALDISSSSAADTNSSGTGARTLDIYGLDKDFNFQKETIALNGQTTVTTAKTYRRVFEAVVATAGSGFLNAGDIYIYKTGTGGAITAGVPGTLTSAAIKVLVGYNYGLSGIWTASGDGKPYDLTSIIIADRAQSGTVLVYHGFPRDNGLSYASLRLDYTPADPMIISMPQSLITVNPGEDCYLNAVGASAGGFLSVILQFLQQGASGY